MDPANDCLREVLVVPLPSILHLATIAQYRQDGHAIGDAAHVPRAFAEIPNTAWSDNCLNPYYCLANHCLIAGWRSMIASQRRLILKFLNFAKALISTIFATAGFQQNLWSECFSAAMALHKMCRKDYGECEGFSGSRVVATGALLVARSLWFELYPEQRFALIHQKTLIKTVLRPILRVALAEGAETMVEYFFLTIIIIIRSSIR